MADNVTIPPTGSGTATPVVATDDVGGIQYQKMKLFGGAAASATRLDKAEDDTMGDGTLGIVALVKRNDTPANTSGTDGDAEFLQVSGGKLWVAPLGFPVTVQTDVTRPGDTTAYAIGDCISNSTSAPTSGGFTLSNAARKSGGSVLITDCWVCSSADPATRLSGEVWLFNQAVTNVNDNSAFVVSDSEIKTCRGVIPFSLFDAGNNGFCHINGLNILVTCVGTADIRFMLRSRTAYTPANAEVFTITLGGMQID